MPTIEELQLKISMLENELTDLKSNAYKYHPMDELFKNNQERYKAIVDRSPEAILIIHEQTVLYANTAALILLKEESLNDIIGKNVLDYVPAQHKALIATRMDAGILTPVTQPLILQGVNNDGSQYYFESIAGFVPFGDKRAVQVIIRDITAAKIAEIETKRLNRALHTLIKVNRKLYLFSDEKTLFNEITSIMCQDGGYLFSWVGYAKEDDYQSIEIVSHSAGYDGFLDKVPLSWGNNLYGQGPAGKAIRFNRVEVITDIEKSDFTPFLIENALKRGIYSMIAIPLSIDNRVFGVLALYSGKVDFIDKNEVELLENLSHDLSFAIKSYRIKEKEAESRRKLYESEQRYRLMFQNGMTGNFILNQLGEIIDCNTSFAKILGEKEPKDLLGKKFKSFLPTPNRFDKFTKKLIEKKFSENKNAVLSAPNRSEINAVISIFAELSNDGEPIEFKGFMFDDTERQKALNALQESEAKLRKLASHQQNAREREREHVAREIHDELGQYLTGLKMDLSFISELIESQKTSNFISELKERLYNANTLLDTTVHAVRRISSDLRPAVLDNLGLVTTIEWMADDFSQRTGIRCEAFITIEDEDFGHDESTAFFRILQESLTNIRKHANATRVSIEFGKDGKYYNLVVKDDGKGITSNELKKSNSFGLLGINERAIMLGGYSSVTKNRKRGTKVSVFIPILPKEIK